MADSEDEDEEEERGQSKEQRKLARQRSRAWLKEGGGDEPLNFLDPKVAQRVLGEQETADRGAQGGPALLLGSCRQGLVSEASLWAGAKRPLVGSFGVCGFQGKMV